MFHGVTGKITTMQPTTTAKPTLAPAPSHIDDDISVYVSGVDSSSVS
jgi:hypothetical protein